MEQIEQIFFGLACGALAYYVTYAINFHSVERCFQTQIELYGDILGEDPNQDPKYILEKAKPLVMACVRGD